jgi:3-oxoacyl-ACP reductase-like protein
MEPTKRLGSEAEGKAWLDAAAQVYAHRVGSTSGGGDSAGGSPGGPEELSSADPSLAGRNAEGMYSSTHSLWEKVQASS